MTLPLIYSLREANSGEKSKIKGIVRSNNHKNKNVGTVISFVKASGGIEYANKVMKEYVREALAILEEFPSSAYRDSLKQMVEFTISRNK